MDTRILKAPRALELTERIGRTPLVPIAALSGVSDHVTVLGKAEWFNPGGSVKDRAAWGMIRERLARGPISRDQVLLDATSGNTGIAIAWIGAALGLAVCLCVPENANEERKRLLAALGAELRFTDRLNGTDGAILEARRLAAADPGRYVYLDQYSNDANWRAHYEGTAEEIWADTGGRVTHFVAGIGTSGTLIGTGRRLRELSAEVQIVAVQPDSPYHALEGLKHLPSAIVPAIYDPKVAHRTIEVESDLAVAMVKRQARRGLLLGWSSGAALVAAERVARALTSGTIVAMLPDGAERYLSEPLWEDA